MRMLLNEMRMMVGRGAIVSMLLFAGCVTDRGPERNREVRGESADVRLLATTNALPGERYEVGVYLVKAGDTVTHIANRVGISPAELRRLNPEMKTSRLRIGQMIRVYERRGDR
jgi:hypothetical protein